MSHDYIIQNGELKHYGVKGMRWGVRRARNQLSKATTKEERNAAVAKLQKHKSKGQAKVAKLKAKQVKLEKKSEKATAAMNKNASFYRDKASNYKIKAGKIALTKFGKKLRKRNARLAMKYDGKAGKLEARARMAENAVKNNKRMQELFNTEISNIDKTLADKGRRYVTGR